MLDAKSADGDGPQLPGFRIDLHIKDLANALDTSHGVGAQLPLTAAVMEMMQALRADGLGTADLAPWRYTKTGESRSCSLMTSCPDGVLQSGPESSRIRETPSGVMW